MHACLPWGGCGDASLNESECVGAQACARTVT